MAEIAPVEPEFTRCYCTGVTRVQVLAAVQRHRCATVDQLRERTGVCGGCGTCRPELAQLLRELPAAEPSPADQPGDMPSAPPPGPAVRDLRHVRPPGSIPVPQREMDS